MAPETPWRLSGRCAAMDGREYINFMASTRPPDHPVGWQESRLRWRHTGLPVRWCKLTAKDASRMTLRFAVTARHYWKPKITSNKTAGSVWDGELLENWKRKKGNRR